ncbi:hypothetical protein M3Y94_00670900 [Aphelenchoides besseyi]|nr:hypothetical protein M3Y94_00670900 [Aphelenchoides besseyi]KAI6231339.1 hypothetical protein M3Y95_00371200 [Aphelenchoides besseyi]
MKPSSSSTEPNGAVVMSSTLQTILENMRRVSYHSEIPNNKKMKIKKFLTRQGELYLQLQQYEARVIDSKDTKNVEVLERERQKLNEKLREVNEWLKENLEHNKTLKRCAEDNPLYSSVLSSGDPKKSKATVQTITLSDSENECVIIDN